MLSGPIPISALILYPAVPTLPFGEVNLQCVLPSPFEVPRPKALGSFAYSGFMVDYIGYDSLNAQRAQ